MAWQAFGTLAAGNQNVSLFDTLTGQIAPCVVIPCTASGSNAIALSGTTNAPALTAYSDLVSFAFLAAGNSSGSVTAQFGGLASLNVYYADGATQVGSGGTVSGQPYKLTWSQALNSGAGGFYLDAWGIQAPSAATTAHGYNAALNLQINASVASGVLTVAIKDASTGNDPTAANPVNISFRDTSSTGTLVQVNVGTALSVSTQAIGATLGVPNSVAFRLWLVAFNNSGTAVLALWHSGAALATPVINPQLNNEAALQSATGFSSAATSSGTFYCPNGTTITSKAFRILGYLDFASNSNLSGAGFVSPTNIQLFGPTIKKPGDTVQTVFATTTTTTNINSTSPVATSLSAAIVPTGAANLVKIKADGSVNNPGSGNNLYFGIYRGTTATTVGTYVPIISSGMSGVSLSWLDGPSSSSSVTYGVFGQTSSGTGGGTSWLVAITGAPTARAQITLEEIMA